MTACKKRRHKNSQCHPSLVLDDESGNHEDEATEEETVEKEEDGEE